MKFTTIKMIMRQQLLTNNILEEDRITLKISANEKPEDRAKTSLTKRDLSHQKSKAIMDFSKAIGSTSSISNINSTCANMNTTSDCRDSSREHPATVSDCRAAPAGNLMQKMYIMTRRVHSSGASTNGQSYAKAASRGAVPSIAKRSKASYNSNAGLLRPALVCLVAMLTLTSSCLLAVQATEGAAASADSVEIVKSNHGHDNKQHPNDRADSLASKSSETHPTLSSSGSSEKSIVASLSSAVASAAASAVVAAAQNSLSSSDARSLVSSSLNRHHSQAQRSPGMNLAIKLVDTIPEVPYNILHNMKKLDHAAPFYNVPNKLSGSTTKESTQNFLTNALQASGNLGGAAEQLSALFRSPLWKRIADGYGEFTSEFRSRFRAPGAAPMKGPTSSTTKLLRDISVPALLMLLASSVSGGDWRPVRTRRKSFAPVDLPAALPGNLATSLPALQSLTDLTPQQYYQPEQQLQSKPNVDPMISDSSASNGWIDQSMANRFQQGQQRQADPSQAIRVNDLGSMQPTVMDGSVTSSWLSPSPQVNVNSPQSLATVSDGGQDQNQLYYGYQPAAGATFQQQQQPAQQQQQPVKRSDEIITPENGRDSGERQAKFATGQERANLFSSLTSELALGQGKLMSKLFNANVGSDGNSYRMTSLADGFNKMSPTRRNLLSDKQRYSLVELTSGVDSQTGGASVNEQKSSAKPFLSAMAHAVSSMLGGAQSSSGESGSSAAASPLAGKPSFFTRANLQQLIGEQTINHENAFARRQPQQRDSSAAAEQRDLTKLLPETWREVVKRTMSTVQQQANVQWKSIEGQLANWVQDKLKTAASSASASPTSSSSSPSSGGIGSNAPPAPVANMLASISTSALNILGLHKNTSNSSTHSHSGADHHAASSVAKVEKSAPASGGSESVSVNQRGKLEKKQSSTEQQQPSKGALASVASVLVKSLTNRQSSSSTTPSSPLLPRPTPPKSAPADPTPTALTANDASPSSSSSLSHKAQSPAADDTLGPSSSSSSSGIASKYPTLTGAQPEADKLASQATSVAATAAAAAAAASQVNVNNAND